MDISPNEAKDALDAIQKMTSKTRHSIASSGAYIFLIATGAVWMIGFLSTQFLTGKLLGAVWVASSVIASVVAVLTGIRNGKRVREPSAGVQGKRAGLFWGLLVLFAIALIAVVHPTDGKQMTMIIVLFMMIGQMAMGLLLSFSSVWWVLPISILALIGYFLLPGIFYLWMGILVGGGMIALGIYIRLRW